MRFRVSVLFVLSLILAFCAAAAAQIAVGITDADRAEFARHRAALFERVGDEVAILVGAFNRDDVLRWRQDNRFYYLTGCEIPYAALLLDGRSDKAILFLPPARTGRAAVYEGPTLGPGPEAAAEFGIDDVRPLEELENVIRQTVPEGGKVLTPLLPSETVGPSPDGALGNLRRHASLPWALSQTREERISQWLQGLAAGITVEDIAPTIDDLRYIKSPWELERMAESCRIAGEGHVAAWRATRPGAMEWEIEAAATAAFLANGAMHVGYCAIVGSGPNNNILHYPLSSRAAQDGELVLMDFGPDYRYYISDITRTWPVSGRFSDEQRRAYLDVLEIQQKIIEFIKPGETMRSVNVFYRGLMEAKGHGSPIHGFGHPVGMAVHDVGSWARPFEPGMVLTVEPGAYLFDKGYGIRIEDEVVVTEDGCRVLSDMIPKHPDEIEAIMAGGSAQRH